MITLSEKRKLKKLIEEHTEMVKEAAFAGSLSPDEAIDVRHYAKTAARKLDEYVDKLAVPPTKLKAVK